MPYRFHFLGGVRGRVYAAAAGLGLGAALLSGAAAAPASAIPIPPSASSCTYNGSPVVIPAMAGTPVTVSCTGLPPNTLLVVAEASPLAGVISPKSSGPAEADLGKAVAVSTSAAGTLTATITLGATGGTPGFSAVDPNAVCPPTQAQVNAGLTNCVVTVANLTTATGLNFASIIFGTEPSPNPPTLRLKPHKSHHIRATGKLVKASDAAGACPTPVTATSMCWWGAALAGVPNAAFGIPGFTVTINGTPVTNTLAASPAVYCASGATAAACAGLAVRTLVGPHLSGTILVPPTISRGSNTVAALEPNTTPDPGNGPGNTVAATAAFMH